LISEQILQYLMSSSLISIYTGPPRFASSGFTISTIIIENFNNFFNIRIIFINNY